VGAILKAADCFGVILRTNGGEFTFVSAESGKVYATLDKTGLKVLKRRKGGVEENVIPIRTLRVLLKEMEKSDKG
jgi:hypothetical protein